MVREVRKPHERRGPAHPRDHPRADERIDECIEWQAPTFTFEGNLASFHPKSQQHASLRFHAGARIPGPHPRLEGTSGVSRLGSVREAEAARKDLERRAWCDWKAAPAKKPAAKAKKPAARAPAKKPAKR